VGLGRFGRALAKELHDAGADLIIIDRDEEKVAMARDWTENAFIVRGLDKKTLIETGMPGCDVAVVCIGSQIDTSILTSLNLVSLGIPKVIAKATSTEHGEILKKLGAEVVYPERDMGIRLAHRLETSQTLDYVQLSEKVNISKNLVPTAFIGKTVVEVSLRREFGLNIIAVENGGEVVNAIGPNYEFKANDILYLSGSKEAFIKFSDWSDT
jgi:trk system potassium uptake protein TrkA